MLVPIAGVFELLAAREELGNECIGFSTHDCTKRSAGPRCLDLCQSSQKCCVAPARLHLEVMEETDLAAGARRKRFSRTARRFLCDADEQRHLVGYHIIVAQEFPIDGDVVVTDMRTLSDVTRCHGPLWADSQHVVDRRVLQEAVADNYSPYDRHRPQLP